MTRLPNKGGDATRVSSSMWNPSEKMGVKCSPHAVITVRSDLFFPDTFTHSDKQSCGPRDS